MTETIRTADGLELRLHSWPARHPVMTVALCHGYGEHAGRYEHVARAFNEGGISLVGADLRGHGRSPGRRGHVSRFSEYVTDLDAIVAAARERSRGAVALLAHSMGGLISCRWLLSYGGGAGLDGLVLTSPFLGLHRPRLSGCLISPLAAIAPRLKLRVGFSGRDLTHDPVLARARDADPLINKRAVLRTIGEALETAEEVHEKAGRIECPTLLLYAGSDRIVDADSTDRFAGALAMSDRVCERLPGLFHEILNETPEVRGPLIERIRTWLLERARPASGAGAPISA